MRELKSAMEAFDTSATRNRVWARRYVVGGTICSAVTTILLGLQGVPDSSASLVKNAALIVSSSVTVLSAFNVFYNHRQLWVRYTTTWARLKIIQKDLTFLLASTPTDKDEQIDELYKRFKTALEETDASWVELRKDNSTAA